MKKYRINSIYNLIFNYSTVAYNIVAGIVLVPMYLSKITLELYGSFLTVTAIANLIGLMEFGLSMILTQRLARSFAQTDWQQFRKYVHSSIFVSTTLFILTCFITFLTSYTISIITNINPKYESDVKMAFILLGIAAAGNIYLNVFGSIFQALLKAGTFGIINLISAIVGIIAVVLMFNAHGNLASIASGMFLRTMCANFILFICTYWTLYKNNLLPVSSTYEEAIILMKNCIPIFLGGLSKSLAENTQNLLLVNLVSPSAVAIFSLNQKVMQVCSLIIAPIGSSVYSSFTQIKQTKKSSYFKYLINISIKSHYLLSIIIIGTATAFNENFISLWVGVDKFGGYKLSVLAGISCIIITRFYFLSFIIYSKGDFQRIFNIEIKYAFGKILLLFILIPQVGIMAIPIAEVISGFIFLYLYGNRLLSVQPNKTDCEFKLNLDDSIDYLAIIFFGLIFTTVFSLKNSWFMLAQNTLIFSIICMLYVFFRRKKLLNKIKTMVINQR